MTDAAETERLYYTDSYLRTFEAAVVDRADGGRRVYLDRTVFYPTSGGQPFDLGRLNGTEVTDVVDEGDRIAHLLAQPVDQQRVAGSIDWSRRFDHMQQHTGQHLLSAVLAELYGHATSSVHFGRESSTLDLDTAAIAHDALVGAESRANQVVVENRPVSVSFEDAATASGLRKAPDRPGVIRIVTIGDLDRSACGGTHVRATGEIGAILIRKVERVRKAVRLEFLCGGRAAGRARADFDLLSRLAGSYSAAPDELPGLLEAERAERKAFSAARRELEHTLNQSRARELYAGAVPRAAGVKAVMALDQQDPIERVRALGQLVSAMPKALFLGTVTNPAAVVVATSEDSGIDAARALDAALEQVGGRGGGNARLAQGRVNDPAAMARLIEVLLGE